MTYTYDALNRLVHAETAGAQWGQGYTFDGFGNLTAKTVTGTGTNFAQGYSASTNQAIGYSYDGNGNPAGPVYDAENRMTAYSTTSYWYDPSGKRVMQAYPDNYGGTLYWIYFYGVDGRRLEEMRCDVTPGNPSPMTACNSGAGNVHFSGRTVVANGVPVVTDRMGRCEWGWARRRCRTCRMARRKGVRRWRTRSKSLPVVIVDAVTGRVYQPPFAGTGANLRATFPFPWTRSTFDAQSFD